MKHDEACDSEVKPSDLLGGSSDKVIPQGSPPEQPRSTPGPTHEDCPVVARPWLSQGVSVVSVKGGPLHSRGVLELAQRSALDSSLVSLAASSPFLVLGLLPRSPPAVVLEHSAFYQKLVGADCSLTSPNRTA